MKTLAALVVAVALLPAMAFSETVVKMSDYGVNPGKSDVSARVAKALIKIESRYGKKDITLVFDSGTYNFYPEKSVKREYYVSNHDQTNPKSVGINLEGWQDLTVDGGGAEFMFHGRMLPIALVNSNGVTLKNFRIDFFKPQVSQAEIVENTDSGIVFRPEPWVDWTIDKNHRFVTKGHGWALVPNNSLPFEADSRRMVYLTGDLWMPLDSVVMTADGSVRAPRFGHKRVKPGHKLVMRTYDRPAPGIFLAEDTATNINNVIVHYAEGMGLLAQLCDSVSLDGFSVCLRGDGDPRYFTTQADATHFSGCKGHIDSRNGLYENMADDAINVHGTYLRIVGRPDDHTLIGRYMHDQSWGFKWGDVGDTVQFVMSRTMELAGGKNVIAKIEPNDKPTVNGAREMRVTFVEPLDSVLNPGNKCGMENLAWTPTVTFEHNTVRNNRARGALFSTPRLVVVRANYFDHVSGTGILLCGDCNGWYETGACRDVRIIDNTFVNPLTNMYQFTEAAISIYPEIPDLDNQVKLFHGGKSNSIVIEGNRFAMFDAPLLYAKSVDGLIFRKNTVTSNHDYPAFHRNRYTFRLQKVKNVVIESNEYDKPESVSIKMD